MKKNLALVFSFLLLHYISVSQVQGTIKLGSRLNSVYIAFTPVTSMTASKFSTFQFAVGIPDSIAGTITASVTSLDPLMTYAPMQKSIETQNGVNYTVFSFSGDGAQSGPGANYNASTEYNYAEVFFTAGSVSIQDVRIMQVPNGGTNTNVNFYVADKGTDVTDVAAQFYSINPLNVQNDGLGYGGSSFAEVGPVVLPVKFLSFTATKKDNTAILNWQVENESAITKSYEVERSLNGVDFKDVVLISPKNNGLSGNSYTSTDANLSSIRTSGVIYYRIKQTDKDGREIYTEIKTVHLDGKALSANIYPNPVKGKATLSIDLVNSAKVIISINDVSGKTVQYIELSGLKGLNTKEINFSGLSAGSYMLQIQAGDEIKTLPVVKGN